MARVDKFFVFNIACLPRQSLPSLHPGRCKTAAHGNAAKIISKIGGKSIRGRLGQDIDKAKQSNLVADRKKTRKESQHDAYCQTGNRRLRCRVDKGLAIHLDRQDLLAIGDQK